MKSLQIAFPDSDGRLGYGLFVSGQSKAVSGNPAIEQLAAKLLLTDIGTDLQNPTLGGSLRERTAQYVTRDTLRARVSEIGRSVVLVENQIRSTQAGLTLPAAERLLSIDIEKLDYEFSTSAWTIRLHLRMEDGNVRRVLLT